MLISYEDTKRDFEAYQFKVLYPRLRFITIPPHARRDHLKYHSQKLEQFKSSNVDIQTTKDGKMVQFLSIWLKDPYARTYDFKVFKPPPLVCHRTDYNAFRGFKLSGEDQSPIGDDHRNYFEEFCTFALNLLGSKEVMDTVLKRYACCLKAPGVRTNICLVLYDRKGGTGKSVFLRTLHEIFEGYCATVCDVGQLKWDIFQKERLFILINTFESNQNISRYRKEILKRMNSNTIVIRQKYEEKELITNLCDYDMTANIKCFDDNTPGILQVHVSNYYIGKSAFFQDFCSNIIRNPIALCQIQQGLLTMY